MLRTILLIALLFLPQTRPVAAASAFAGEFLALGGGARAMALGNAYVALVDDATSGYWNAAALSGFEGRQVHLSHAELYSGLVQHDYLALAVQGRRIHGLALSLVRVGVDDIKFTTLEDPTAAISADNRPVVASTETSADYALYLSGGHRLSSRLAIGASLKMIYRSVGPFSAYGGGLDLALRYRLVRGFTLAAVLRDVTTTPIVWDDSTDSIRPSTLVGAAYTLPVAGGHATVGFASRAGGDAADGTGNEPVNAGIEYSYENLALRAGFEESRQAVGIGIRSRDRLEVDLAYLQHDELESTYRLSAGFRF